jgi:predicted porin
MIGSDSSIFTLQYQLSIDSNSGVGFNTGSTGARQQFVGLSSATLGTVALGRQHAPRYQASKNNAPCSVLHSSHSLTSVRRQYHHADEQRALG